APGPIAARHALGAAVGSPGAGDHGGFRAEDLARGFGLEERGERSAAGADHHGPAKRAVDAGGGMIDRERVAERKLEPVVTSRDPQAKQPMPNEPARHALRQRREAIRVARFVADERAE